MKKSQESYLNEFTKYIISGNENMQLGREAEKWGRETDAYYYYLGATKDYAQARRTMLIPRFCNLPIFKQNYAKADVCYNDAKAKCGHLYYKLTGGEFNPGL